MPTIIALLSAALVMYLAALLIMPRVKSNATLARFDVVSGHAPVEEGNVEDKEKERTNLQSRLAAADLNITSETFYVLSLVAGLVVFVLAMVLGVPLLLSLAVAGVGAYLPTMWIDSRAGRHWKGVAKELSNGVAILMANLRIKPNTAVALQETASQLEKEYDRSELALEFRRTAADARAHGLEGALRMLEKRSPLPALDLLARSLILYSQVGGDFLPVLEQMGEHLQGMNMAHQEAEAEAADALLVGKVVPGLLGLLVLFLMHDPELGEYFRRPIGQIVLIVAFGMMAVGYRVMVSMKDEIG